MIPLIQKGLVVTWRRRVATAHVHGQRAGILKSNGGSGNSLPLGQGIPNDIARFLIGQPTQRPLIDGEVNGLARIPGKDRPTALHDERAAPEAGRCESAQQHDRQKRPSWN